MKGKLHYAKIQCLDLATYGSQRLLAGALFTLQTAGFGLGKPEIPPSLAIPRKPQANHFSLPGLSSSEPGD